MTQKNKEGRGFLYYAHNTEHINYLKLAIMSAITGKHYISEFRATVVTDNSSLSHLDYDEHIMLNMLFENIYIRNIEPTRNKRILYNGHTIVGNVVWLNHTRPDAYIESPYEETILIDCDFIFQNNDLELLWNSSKPIRMYRNVLSAYNNTMMQKELNEYTHKNIGRFTIPMFWATVVYFNRSDFCETFFGLIKEIKDGYAYYTKYYQLFDGSYRNDYAFSIALHIMNGFRIPDKEWEIHYPMVLITPRDYVYRIDKGQTKFIIDLLSNTGKYNVVNIQNMSYHCMNKLSLYEKYNQIIEVYFND